MADYMKQFDFLEIAAYDQNNMYHNVSTISAQADPKPREYGDQLARGVWKNFQPTIIEGFLQRPDVLDDIDKKLKAKKQIALITTHENLTDIAQAAYGLNHALSVTGRIPFEELVSHSDIILSRTLTTLQAKVGDVEIDAIDLVRMLGTIYFSFPNSQRIREGSNVSQDIIDMHNQKLKEVLQNRVCESDTIGRILCVAAPGTGNIMRDDEIIIPRITPGTEKLITQDLDIEYYLRVDISYNTHEKICLPNFLQPIERIDLHNEMIQNAHTRTRLTHIPTKYEAE